MSSDHRPIMLMWLLIQLLIAIPQLTLFKEDEQYLKQDNDDSLLAPDGP
jgi:hypothetical protein